MVHWKWWCPVLLLSSGYLPPVKSQEVTTQRDARKILGDDCKENSDCKGIKRAVCEQQTCACPERFPIKLNLDSCLSKVKLNETCVSSKQCMRRDGTDDPFATCKDGVCVCDSSFKTEYVNNEISHCTPKKRGEESSHDDVDPAMIGILVALALMFIVVCVVLQMFSKARFRENRTIFNTPNARLMNISILSNNKNKKKKKKKSGSAGSRRSGTGSQAPSPCPSLDDERKVVMARGSSEYIQIT